MVRKKRMSECGTNLDNRKDSDRSEKSDEESMENMEMSADVCDAIKLEVEKEGTNETEIAIDEDVSTGDTAEKANTFAAKKTAAQGMMDIALITANANQLRYIMEFLNKSWNYYVILTLVIVSLALQIAVGMALIFKGKLALRGKSKNLLLNNFITVGVFLITIINIFIASLTDTGNHRKGN